MDAREIVSLSQWYQREVQPVVKYYKTLSSVLQHNASQPDKQPVREPLNELTEKLDHLPITDLTIGQTRLLADLDVFHLLGLAGSRHLKNTLSTSDFDPASAAADVQTDLHKITGAGSKLQQAETALTEIQIEFSSVTSENNRAFAIVLFKDDASISNISELKKWSAEWYDIGRGLAICADETPQDVKVVGAQSGSLILYLSIGVLVTALLARMTKHLAFIAKELISVDLAREQLQQQKLLTETIRNDLAKQREALENEGKQKVFDEVKSILGDRLKPENEGVLQKAVEKYSKFYSAGGEVELISNFAVEEREDDTDSYEIAQINKEVSELRELREEIRLLESRKSE
jgi:hypothetical protein